MSKTISVNEFWDTIKNVFEANNKRDIGTVHLDKKYGEIKLNYFSTGAGITYSSFDATFSEDTTMQSDNAENRSFLCFNTGHNVSMEHRNDKEKIKFDTNICWSGKQNKNHKSQAQYIKDKRYFSHYITFDNNLFDTITDQSFQQKETKPFFQAEDLQINFHRDISLVQTQLLHKLHSGLNLNGKLQEIYLESKILDLVYNTMSESNNRIQHNEIYLNNSDIYALKKAKKILLDDLSNPPSLNELAKKIATNEFKLKKGFKQLFGNTVYGFVQEQRLLQAKILLEHNDINVSEAAALVGYKSIGHFSKIFKEKFGLLASDIMKNRKYYY